MYDSRAPRTEGEEHVQRLLYRVKAAGLKMTPQRIAIIREVAADETHPSAQELFDRLRLQLPNMSFATVYNTLASLCAAGLGASLSLTPGSARFDPNMHPHSHTVCDRCGAVRDVPDLPPVRAAGRPKPALSKAAPGFEVRVVEKIFRGVCLDCAGSPSARGLGTNQDGRHKLRRSERRSHRQTPKGKEHRP
jgi:Fur family peroxide stress response transcriptional regulator